MRSILFYADYPVFSILDPTVTFSLPDFQIACGLADTFVHVMEQYMTKSNESYLMDRWSESILRILVQIAPLIKENKQDYHLMSEFMMSATMALNGFIAMGVSQDWATHMIGHELTALHGMTHGQTLAIVFPGTLRTLADKKTRQDTTIRRTYLGGDFRCAERTYRTHHRQKPRNSLKDLGREDSSGRSRNR